MSLGKRFLEFLDRRMEGFGGAQYKTFGIFGIINYPLGYYMLHLLGADESAIARLSAALMCIPLIFTKKWPPKLKEYLNLYWFLTLLYCIPVFGTYTLLKNQVSTDWLMNFSLGLFLLFLLVDYVLLLIIYALGILLGYLLFALTGQEVIFQNGFPTDFVYIYGTMTILGCIFARNKERLEYERVQAMKMIAGTVAHEMRTPLFAVTNIAYTLKEDLPVLINVHETVRNMDLKIEMLDKKQVEMISRVPEKISRTNQNALSVIDILLMNLKEDFRETPLTICSIRECVEDAINLYPFIGKERELVTYNVEENFDFKGDNDLIRHVLFNLLKNSIYYVKAANKGNITITSKVENNMNKLYFKDTGKGISKNKLPYIFEKFYSRTEHGTGIGLDFCKMVMKNLGGDITCQSVEGEFTEFILSFPVIK